jgi:L-2-hydroxyglutarate oxidase LhgO
VIVVVVVIGGGIVGCFVAREMAGKGAEVFLLDKEKALGEHTSTRNSGVIHGGIYYAEGSLKAKLCVRGRHLTYDFLEKHDVPSLRCGKVIVALKSEELQDLEALKALGDANGVEGLRLVDGKAVQSMEPRVRCLGGLYSPETGLVDMAVYMRTVERLLRGAGVTIVKLCKVLAVGDDNVLTTSRGEIEADILVNAAGLHSDRIAAMCGLEGYEIIPHKGDYYNTTDKVVRSLVYPVPHSSLGLGIHLTPTFGEEILIGPSVLRVSDKEDYEIRTPQEAFEGGALAMIPDLDVTRLYPGFSGNRPKLYDHGQLQTDFRIECQGGRRVHLLGIESPGLTAAPAIGEYVAGIIEQS